MIFVFDLDDTLCETDLYSEYYIKEYIKKNNLPYKQIAKVTRFADMKFDWSQEIANSWYKQHGDIMFLHFPVKGNSVDIINKLYDDGHTIIIATARSTDWHSQPEKMTLIWLEKVGLKYHKLYVGRSDKEEICKEENADVFVDDDIDIVTRVNKCFKLRNKGKAFLSKTNYNKKLNISPEITVIDNLDNMLESLNINVDKDIKQI